MSVIHPACQHEGQTIAHMVGGEHTIARQRVQPSVGQRRCHDRHAFRGRGDGAGLEVQFQDIFQGINTVWKRLRFLHHIAQTPIPVRRCTLGLVCVVVVTNSRGVGITGQPFPNLQDLIIGVCCIRLYI